MRKILLSLLALCAVPFSVSAQVTAKTELPANNRLMADALGKPANTTPHEHQMDGEALAFLLGEYMRRTGPWAPPADGFLKIPSRNFVHGYPNGSLVWPGNEPRSKDAWDNILKSQGVPVEKMTVDGVAASGTVMVFISEEESQELSVGTGRLIGSTDPLIAISFGKGFYCYPFVRDGAAPIVSSGCFLDAWRDPNTKNARSEAELAYRIVLMVGWLHKFNALRDNSILEKMDTCFNGQAAKTFRKIQETITGLERDRQSGQIDERAYVEKLAPLEKEAQEIASREQTRSCAEFLFQYEYNAASAIYEASQRITVCLRKKQDCKKPGEFSKTPLPVAMAQFLRYASKKSALENYVRHTLPRWYQTVAPLYKPMWATYKMPN